MYNRQDVFNKYYKSDIFNLNQSDSKARKTKGVIRPNFPTLESTKEDLFNVGKERRIQRNGRNRDEYPDEPQNRTGISLSVGKRRKNYDKIYGSDIFNQKAASAERPACFIISLILSFLIFLIVLALGILRTSDSKKIPLNPLNRNQFNNLYEVKRKRKNAVFVGIFVYKCRQNPYY